MPDFIELTPSQSASLMAAWRYERNRARHEAEPWPSRAVQDIEIRDGHLAAAIELGVPAEQAERFVYSEPWTPDA
jgi:hypothetical protein